MTSPSSSNEQLNWLIQNVQAILNAKEKEEEDRCKEAMVKEPGYPPKVREAIASIQADARKTIAAKLFSEFGGRPPTGRLKNYLDSWIQLAYPEPGKGQFLEFGYEVTIELKPLVLRDVLEEQERTGAPIARDSMGLPYNLKIQENYDRFPGITSARPKSQRSVMPSEGLATPDIPGEPSDDGGSDSWSTEEDSLPEDLVMDNPPGDHFVEELTENVKAKLNVKDKKDKKEKRAPGTLAEWFHFEDEEPKGDLVPEQSIPETGQNEERRTSEDKIYTWDKKFDAPIVARGFSPVSPPRAREMLKVNQVAKTIALQTTSPYL